MMALDFADKMGRIPEEEYRQMLEEMKRLPELTQKILDSKQMMQKCADETFNANSIFYIGRGLDYAAAMEGSLKLKEISYIHSEAYAAGELKHGTIALIEEGTPVVALATQGTCLKNVEQYKGSGKGELVIAVAVEAIPI